VTELMLYFKKKLTSYCSSSWFEKHFPASRPLTLSLDMESISKASFRKFFSDDNGDLKMRRIKKINKHVQKMGCVQLNDKVWMNAKFISSFNPRQRRAFLKKVKDINGKKTTFPNTQKRQPQFLRKTTEKQELQAKKRLANEEKFRRVQERQRQMEITEKKARRNARARRKVVTSNQVERGSMKGLRSKRTPKTSTSKRTPNSHKTEKSSKRTPGTKAMNNRAEELRKGSDIRRKKSDPTLSPAAAKRRKKALHIPPTNDTEGDSPLHSPSTTGNPNLQPVTPRAAIWGGGAVPFREVKMSPHMDVAGKTFLLLGDFTQFSQRKVVAWLEKRGGRITKKMQRKVSIAICAGNVPQSVSDRLVRLEIERWDEFDTLNYVAMYYLKSDFLPAEYRIINTDQIAEHTDHPFSVGDEVVLNGKKKMEGDNFVQVIQPVSCYLPESCVERIFELWSSSGPVEYFAHRDLRGKGTPLRTKAMMSNMTHEGKIHIWYPKQGWVKINKSKMTMSGKLSASEFIGSKLQG